MKKNRLNNKCSRQVQENQGENRKINGKKLRYDFEMIRKHPCLIKSICINRLKMINIAKKNKMLTIENNRVKIKRVRKK